MALYNSDRFIAAVDKVRLKGVLVQEAKAEAERVKNVRPWLDALDELMRAKTSLDEIILQGLDMEHPALPLEAVASCETAPQIVETVNEQTEHVSGPAETEGFGTLPTTPAKAHADLDPPYDDASFARATASLTDAAPPHDDPSAANLVFTPQDTEH